ncbi:MAG: hypothetical protein K0Q66_758 [Chitinophagaceae bacterium]|jgi:hypothetical protein|nr:hypothetical protein [Chitinophagaceae bacterium]
MPFGQGLQVTGYKLQVRVAGEAGKKVEIPNFIGKESHVPLDVVAENIG